eukprot:gb/GECG01007789.1/.p1 GENE.gb/GECG01007789.1/~~gb/GECG01007789.1/.p1  ORF type:complete len:411 (+),score=50.48 gb/GECG01007789.1/:1-1233(+)
MSSPPKPWQQQQQPSSHMAQNGSITSNTAGPQQVNSPGQTPPTDVRYPQQQSSHGAMSANGRMGVPGSYASAFNYQTPTHMTVAPQPGTNTTQWTAGTPSSSFQYPYQSPYSAPAAASYSSPFFNQMGSPSPYFGNGGNAFGLGSNPPPYLHSHFNWLQQLHSAVGAIGAITDLMGMNAEAFRHIIHGVIGFIERVGITVGEAIKFMKSEPPVDETGNYLVDPEEYHKEKRRKLLRIGIGALVILLSVSALRRLFRGSSTQRSSEISNAMQNAATSTLVTSPTKSIEQQSTSWKRILLTTCALLSGFGCGVLYGQSGGGTMVNSPAAERASESQQQTTSEQAETLTQQAWDRSQFQAARDAGLFGENFREEDIDYDSDADSLTGSPELTRRLNPDSLLNSLASRFSASSK